MCFSFVLALHTNGVFQAFLIERVSISVVGIRLKCMGKSAHLLELWACVSPLPYGSFGNQVIVMARVVWFVTI